MSTVLWSLLAFVSGCIPCSVWLGRLLCARDVRQFGDGNPGGVNAWKAGGWRVGAPAILLDMCKGAVPVSLAATVGGIETWGLIPVGLGPVLGHGFSPFLRLRGGKANAVSVGVWAALTSGMAVPVLLLFLGFAYALQRTDAWTVIFGGVGVFGLLLIRFPEPYILLLWAANMAFLILKHRHDLRLGVAPRPWLLRMLGRTA